MDLFARFAATGLTHTIVWSARSYIGLWKGSKVWCAVWPRNEAARLYLPPPKEWAEGSEEAPPIEFQEVRKHLAEVGVKVVWAWSYDSGTHPIALTIRAEHLKLAAVTELLRDTWTQLP